MTGRRPPTSRFRARSATPTARSIVCRCRRLRRRTGRGLWARWAPTSTTKTAPHCHLRCPRRPHRLLPRRPRRLPQGRWTRPLCRRAGGPLRGRGLEQKVPPPPPPLRLLGPSCPRRAALLRSCAGAELNFLASLIGDEGVSQQAGSAATKMSMNLFDGDGARAPPLLPDGQR